MEDNKNNTQYINGAPIIHSLEDDIGVADNDIMKAHTQLQTEKKVKTWIIVIITIVIVFAIIIVGYFYFRDRANTNTNQTNISAETIPQDTNGNIPPPENNNQELSESDRIKQQFPSIPDGILQGIDSMKTGGDYVAFVIKPESETMISDFIDDTNNRDVWLAFLDNIFNTNGLTDFSLYKKDNLTAFINTNGNYLFAYSLIRDSLNQPVLIFSSGLRGIFTYK